MTATATALPGLQDLLTVMDTLDVFQEADRSQLDPSEVRRRVRTVYANQDLPLDERALHHAVELYLHPEGPPVPAVIAPPRAMPAPVAIAPPAPAVQPAERPGRVGFGLLELILVMGMVMTMSMTAFVIYPVAKAASVANTLAGTVTSAVAHPLAQAQADLQSPEATRALASVGITAQVADDGQGSSKVTLSHVSAEVALKLTQSLAGADPHASRDRRRRLQSDATLPWSLHLNQVNIERLADAQAMMDACDQQSIACPAPNDLTVTVALPPAP